MHENGLGIEQDYNAAIEWYRKAAAQGILNSQKNLLNMYQDGLGIPQNNSEAMAWFLEAAQKKNIMGSVLFGKNILCRD